MSDETTPQDDAAMSPASAGSVAEIERLRSKLRLQDAVIRSGATPLALTDAEREAIRVARDAYADDDGNAECERIAAVLSGLLERLK